MVHLFYGNEKWIRQRSRSNLASPLSFQVKCEAKSPLPKHKNNSSNCKKGSSEHKSKISIGEECRADEQAFLVALYKYMKERKTPIERIPYLGFKQSKQKFQFVFVSLGGEALLLSPFSFSWYTCHIKPGPGPQQQNSVVFLFIFMLLPSPPPPLATATPPRCYCIEQWLSLQQVFWDPIITRLWSCQCCILFL